MINAGGIINVSTEYLGDGEPDLVRARIEAIPGRLEQIWAESAATGRNPAAVADAMAQRLIGRALIEGSGRGPLGRGTSHHARLRQSGPLPENRATATGWLLGVGGAAAARRRRWRAVRGAARLSAGRERPHPLRPCPRRLARHGGLDGDRRRQPDAAGLAPSARRGRRARDRRPPARSSPPSASPPARSGAGRPGAPSGNGTGG